MTNLKQSITYPGQTKRIFSFARISEAYPDNGPDNGTDNGTNGAEGSGGSAYG